MYDYTKVRIEADPCNETVTDLLASFLADGDYETFEPDDSGLNAYVRKDKYNPEFIEEIINDFPIATSLSYSKEEIKGEDWNREWEQNYFKPIVIGDRLVVRSSFHTDFPEAEIGIVIDPKMAFGTGHHATTAGMSLLMMEEDIKEKSVIDMGTGTGILSILAKKLGASETIGIDIDEFAIENARENGLLNSSEVDWIVGDDRALSSLKPADIFLANINLNVIKDNLHKYINKVNPGGAIFLSGFLSSDRDEIMNLATKLGLKFAKLTEADNWLAMKFIV